MSVIPEQSEELDDIPTFAKRIRSKFGAYDDVDDVELVERFVRKDPIYASKVKLPPEFRLLNTTSGYKNIDDLYEQAGREHNVDPNLLLEQGRTETVNFDPDVFYGRRGSPKGAKGSGQFIPGTAKRFNVDVNDPRSGVDGQARYMRELLDQFDGDENLALAGYNAGEGVVHKYGKKIPPYKETQKYTKQIGEELKKARDKGLTLRNFYTPADVTSAPEDTGTIYGQPAYDPTNPPPPALETDDTILAQLKVASDTTKPRKGVYFPPNDTERALQIAQSLDPKEWGLFPDARNGGHQLVHLPSAKKLKLRSATDIQTYINKNPEALITLTSKAYNAGQNTGGNQQTVSTIHPQTGVELTSSVVTPETRDAQIALDKANHPDGVSVDTTTDAVVANRLAPIADEYGNSLPLNTVPQNPDDLVIDMGAQFGQKPTAKPMVKQPVGKVRPTLQPKAGQTANTAKQPVTPTPAPTEDDYQAWRGALGLDDDANSRQQFQMARAVAPNAKEQADVEAAREAQIQQNKWDEEEAKQTSTPKAQKITDANKYDAVAESIAPPDNLTEAQANEYIRKQLTQKYGGDYTGFKFLTKYEPGKTFRVTYGDLKSAGVDIDALLSEQKAQKRVEQPTDIMPFVGQYTPQKQVTMPDGRIAYEGGDTIRKGLPGTEDGIAPTVFQQIQGLTDDEVKGQNTAWKYKFDSLYRQAVNTVAEVGGSKKDIDAEYARLMANEDMERDAALKYGKEQGERYGSASSGFVGSGGESVAYPAAIMRALNTLVPSLNDIGGRKLQNWLTNSSLAMAQAQATESEKNPDNVSSIIRMGAGAPGFLSRLGVSTMLPGGAQLTFAKDAAIKSFGQGNDVGQVFKDTGVGLATDLLFKGGSALGEAVKKGALKKLLTKEAIEVVENGGLDFAYKGTDAAKKAFINVARRSLVADSAGMVTRLGVIGGGTYAMATAEGSKTPGKDTAMMLLFDLVMHAKKIGKMAKLSTQVWRVPGEKPDAPARDVMLLTEGGDKIAVYDVTGKYPPEAIEGVISRVPGADADRSAFESRPMGGQTVVPLPEKNPVETKSFIPKIEPDDITESEKSPKIDLSVEKKDSLGDATQKAADKENLAQGQLDERRKEGKTETVEDKSDKVEPVVEPTETPVKADVSQPEAVETTKPIDISPVRVRPDMSDKFNEAKALAWAKIRKKAEAVDAETSETAKLPEIKENHLRELSDFSPVLYREVSPDKAVELLSGNSTDDKPYFANTPNLAMGQGSNKGVVIELDSKGLQGQVNTSKPAWESAYANGEAEFIGKYNKSYLENVKNVTISKETIPKAKRLYSALQNPKYGFSQTQNKDGSVTFTRKAQPKAEAVKEPQSAVDRIKSEAASIANAVSDRKANITKHYQYDFKVRFLRKHGLPETLIDDTNFQKAFGAGVLENELGGSLGDIDPKLIPQVLANPEPFIEAYRNNKVVQEVAGKPYTAGDEKRVARSLRADYAKVARTAKLTERRAERATNLEAAKKEVADRKAGAVARRSQFGDTASAITYATQKFGNESHEQIKTDLARAFKLKPTQIEKVMAEVYPMEDRIADAQANLMLNRTYSRNFSHLKDLAELSKKVLLPTSKLRALDKELVKLQGDSPMVDKWNPEGRAILDAYEKREAERKGEVSGNDWDTEANDLSKHEKAELRSAYNALSSRFNPALRSIPNTDPLQGIITETGVNYDRAKDVAGRIAKGELEIRRLDPAGEQGRIAGGSRNVESTIILAGNEAASEAAGSRTHPVKRQERALEEYARHEGIWIDPKEFNSDRQGFISKGVEAYVHRSDDGNSVVKLIDYKMIDRHATPLDFIDNRIALFNHLFPGTPYELVGFTRIKDDFRFVVKQRLIRDAVYTKPTERQTYMQGKGLTMTDKYGEAFANDFYKVSDLHEKNALRGADGTIYVIDAVPKAKHVSEFEVVPTDAALRSVSGESLDVVRVERLPKPVDGNASVLKGATNRSMGNPQDFFRMVLGDTFRDKGLGAFDVPSQRMMVAGMLRAIKNLQVRQAIVGLVPVDVMNHLISIKRPSQVSFHNNSVFGNTFAINSDSQVSMPIGIGNSLLRAIALGGTKNITRWSDGGWLFKNDSSTLNARDAKTGSESNVRASITTKGASSNERGGTGELDSASKTDTLNSGHNTDLQKQSIVSGESEIESDSPTSSILPQNLSENTLRKIRDAESLAEVEALADADFTDIDAAMDTSVEDTDFGNNLIVANNAEARYALKFIEALAGDRAETDIDGVFVQRNNLNAFKDTIEGVIDALSDAGITSKGFKALLANVEKAAKGTGTVRLELYSDSRLHETGHMIHYLRAGGNAIRARYKNFDALYKQNEPIIKKMFDRFFGKHYFGGAKYSALTSANKEELFEEARQRILDLNYAREITDTEAAQFFSNEMDAYVEKNGTDILDDYERLLKDAQDFRTEAIKNRGKPKEANSGIQEKQESGESDTAGGGVSEAADGETFVPGGKEKLSKVPSTLRKGGIPVQERIGYTSTTNQERIEFANEQMDKGLDSASSWVERQLDDKNNNSGATGVVGLNVMMQLGKEGRINELNKFADKLVPAFTDAGQMIQSLTIVSMFSPESAGAYMTKVAKQNGQDVTQADIDKATDIATRMRETGMADALIENALDLAQVENEELKKELAEIQEAFDIATGKIKEFKGKLSGQGRTIAALRRKIDGEVSTTSRRPKEIQAKVKALNERSAEIDAAMSAKYGADAAPRMIVGESALRSIPESNVKIDQNDIDWATRQLALTLDSKNPLTPTEFKESIVTATKGMLSKEQVNDLYAQAVSALRTEHTSIADDIKSRNKIRQSHYREADKINNEKFELFGFKVGDPVRRYAATVIRQGVVNNYSDEAIWFALARKEHPDVNDALKALKDEYPDLTPVEKRKVISDSEKLTNLTAKTLQRDTVQKKNEGKLSDEDILAIQAEKKLNTAEKTKVSKEASRFYRKFGMSSYEVILETISNFRRVNLLSAVKTHFVNIGGNVGHAIGEEISRVPASMVDLIASGFTGQRTTAMGAKGIAKGLLALVHQDETLRNAKWDSPDGRERGITAAKHVLQYGGSIADMERLQHSESILSLKFDNRPARWMDNYINGVFRTLGAEDALFKIYAFRRHIEEQARAIAITERRTDKSLDVKARRKELVQNPTAVMQVLADQYAQMMTFQDSNVLSQGMASLKRKSPEIKLGAELLVPYDNTPTNIFLRIMEYTPAGVPMAIGRAAIAKGKGMSPRFRNEIFGAVKNDLASQADYEALSPADKQKAAEAIMKQVWTRGQQERFAKTVGRSITGSGGAFSLGFVLAAAGLMAGAMSFDDDKDETDEAKRRKQAGIENGSIQTPWGWRMSLPKAPITAAMVAGATFYEQMAMSKKSPVIAAMDASEEAYSDMFREQPYLNATYSLLRSLGKGKFGEFTGNLASGFVPASAMLRSLSELTDDKERTGSGYRKDEKLNSPEKYLNYQGRGFRNSFLKGIPWLRRYADESGLSVSDAERGGMGRKVVRMLDPFNTRTEVERQPGSVKEVIDGVVTYAKAIGTDPITAFNIMYKGERIRRVDNGAIVVERMDLEDSEKVKKSRNAAKDQKLDHKMPLQLGGLNDEDNLELRTESDWKRFTPIENALGRALRAEKITKEEAQKLMRDYKNGDITETDITSFKNGAVTIKSEDAKRQTDLDPKPKENHSAVQKLKELGSVDNLLSNNSVRYWSTDDWVEVMRTDMSDADRQKAANALRKKADNAQKAKSLTPDELERVREVIPDYAPAAKKRKLMAGGNSIIPEYNSLYTPQFKRTTPLMNGRQSENVIDTRTGSPLDKFNQAVSSDDIDSIGSAIQNFNKSNPTKAEKVEARKAIRDQINETRYVLRSRSGDRKASINVLRTLLKYRAQLQ